MEYRLKLVCGKKQKKPNRHVHTNIPAQKKENQKNEKKKNNIVTHRLTGTHNTGSFMLDATFTY